MNLIFRSERDANELSKHDAIIQEVQLHFDRRLQDIKRKINSSNHHDEEKIPETNKHRVNLFTHFEYLPRIFIAEHQTIVRWK